MAIQRGSILINQRKFKKDIIEYQCKKRTLHVSAGLWLKRHFFFLCVCQNVVSLPRGIWGDLYQQYWVQITHAICSTVDFLNVLHGLGLIWYIFLAMQILIFLHFKVLVTLIWMVPFYDERKAWTMEVFNSKHQYKASLCGSYESFIIVWLKPMLLSEQTTVCISVTLPM